MDRISIPSAKYPPIAYEAGKIGIAAVSEAGLDPWKAGQLPIMKGMFGAWIRGEWTRAQFIENCRKLLILNPSLAERGAEQ